MAEEIATFQKYFHQTVIGVAAVVTCVGAKGLFNTFAAPKKSLPYGVHQVVPLEDAFGQAHQSSMTRLLVDLKFVSSLPPPATIPAAIKAVRDYFETALSAEFEGYRISVRHERPIFIPEYGATPGEQLLNMGSSYRVWMTAI